MKIFVTGGSGFIGSNFINLCISKGHKVTANKRKKSNFRIPVSDKTFWLEKDLKELRKEDFIGIDTLVHFAATGVIYGSANWDDCFKINVEYSIQTWLKAIDAGVRKLVICGSCFEYGNSGNGKNKICTETKLLPRGPYDSSKAAATMAAIGIAIEKNISISILRPFHVFGTGENETRFWPSLKKAAESGENFKMTLGEQVRDFLPVEDAAILFLNEVENQSATPGNPVIKNIGSGNEMSLKDFADYWWKKWDAKGKILYGVVPYRKNEIMRYVPMIN